MYRAHVYLFQFVGVVSMFIGASMWCAAAKPTRVVQTTNGIEITAEPSRLQPTAGSGFQINAAIKNVSQFPILLSEHTTVLTLPGEIDPYATDFGPFRARFTTQDCEPQAQGEAQPASVAVGDQQGQDNGWCYEALLILPSGQSTHAFWRLDSKIVTASDPSINKTNDKSWPRELSDQVGRDLRYTFFTPGNYKCSIQVKYWPLNDKKDLSLEALRASHYETPNYQIAVADLTVNVSAPETVILLGAILGGFMAFLLGKLRGQDATGTPKPGESLGLTVIRWVSGLAIALLLSVILTIMLSRLSDSPFPIKISISDFWGAIVLGFIAAYTGNTMLDKYLARGAGNKPTP